jgi:hypothetical protein
LFIWRVIVATIAIGSGAVDDLSVGTQRAATLRMRTARAEDE